MGFCDVKCIKHGHDIGRHNMQCIRLWRLRLLTLPMSACVDQNEPEVALQSIDISQFAPRLMRIGDAMKQYQR